MDKSLKKQVDLAFYAPDPVRKNIFLRKLRPREITTPALLLQQVSYIRKTVWVFVLSLLTVAVAGTIAMNANTERIIVAMTPLAALVAILEVNRSYHYRMSEFEFATRFSLKSVLYARMLIIGLAYTLVFCIIAPVVSFQFGIGTAVLAFRILAPYLFTTALCLHLERTKIGRSNAYLSSALALTIAVALLWASGYEWERFDHYVAQWGSVILILLAALVAYENHKTIKMTEGLAWK